MKMEALVKVFGKSLFLFTIVVALIGCVAGGPKSSSGAPIGKDLMGAFKNGEVRLTCGLPCAGRAGFIKRKVKTQYEAGAWRNVVHEVSGAGFESTLSYFLLGRSAEELGWEDAAMTYYLLALSSPRICSDIESCSGFTFPEDILERRDFLTKTKDVAKSSSVPHSLEQDSPMSSYVEGTNDIEKIKVLKTSLPITERKLENKISEKSAPSERSIDVIGIQPGVSTKSQVESKKTGDFFIIGGYQVLCMPEFIRGKLSTLYCETGKDRFSVDKASGLDSPASNIEVHDKFLDGFSEKFGSPTLSEEPVRTNLGLATLRKQLSGMTTLATR